jgi:hypothetical protein
MFFKATLHFHTLTAWIVVLSGLWALIRVYQGVLRRRPWTGHERLAGLVFSSALDTQVLIGLALYVQSSTVRPLFVGGAAGPDRVAASFFGMMHPLTMITAAVLCQVGFSLTKRISDDRRKYRIAVVCYTAACVLLLAAVPWPFLSYGRSLIP